MSDPRIHYAPRAAATPEGELNALAAVYKFVLDCHTRKEGRPTTSGPDSAKGGSENDSSAKTIIPESS